MPIPMKDMSSFWPAAKVDSSPLRISEVMSANVTTLTDDYGAYSDYVEIENTSDSEIDLSGYGLSNKPNKTMKWRFPEGVKIPAHTAMWSYTALAKPIPKMAATITCTPILGSAVIR